MHFKGLRRWVTFYWPLVSGPWRRKLVLCKILQENEGKWGKYDNMTFNFYPSHVFFAKHVFHLDFVKGTKGTDEVKINYLFPIPAAEHNFWAPIFEQYFRDKNYVYAKNAKNKSFSKSMELILLFCDKQHFGASFAQYLKRKAESQNLSAPL